MAPEVLTKRATLRRCCLEVSSIVQEEGVIFESCLLLLRTEVRSRGVSREVVSTGTRRPTVARRLGGVRVRVDVVSVDVEVDTISGGGTLDDEGIAPRLGRSRLVRKATRITTRRLTSSGWWGVDRNAPRQSTGIQAKRAKSGC